MDHRRLRRGPSYQSRGRSGAHGQGRRPATRTGHRRNSKTPEEEPAARSQKTQISNAGRPLTRRVEKSAAAGRTAKIPAARRLPLLHWPAGQMPRLTLQARGSFQPRSFATVVGDETAQKHRLVPPATTLIVPP